MFFKSEDLRHEKRDRVQGGAGYVLIEHLLEGCNLPSNADMFAVCTLEKGCEIGKHVHEGETEFYCCLSGEGAINDHGELHTMRPGDVSSCVSGGYHSIVNRSDNPLKILVVIVKG